MPPLHTDFLIVTPLAEERDAVLLRLPGHQKLPPRSASIRVYYGADLPVAFSDGTEGVYSVVLAPLARMGHTEAATATSDAIRNFNPRFIILIGIAGGIAANDVTFGDVLISDQIADYELAKVTPKGTTVRWQVHRVDERLLIAAQNFTSVSWQATQTPRPTKKHPRVHCGPICTGNKVIADETLSTQLRNVWAKLIGVEMEASGVANAASQSARRPGFFMVRGVSDLADAKKDSHQVTRWRAYACEIAAAWAIEFLKSGPVPLRRKRSVVPRDSARIVPSRRRPAERPSSAPVRSLLPAKPPSPVVGRDEDIAAIKRRLGVGPHTGDDDDRQTTLVINGVTGVGKTALAALICHDAAVEASFDAILWATLGPHPDPRLKLRGWLSTLGCSSAAANDLESEVSQFISALKNRRVLLVLDDVRSPEQVSLFRSGLTQCRSLFTTRNRAVGIGIAPSAAMHELPLLSEDDALTLLLQELPDELRAHVRQHEDRCRKLVADLACLPLLVLAAAHLLASKAALKNREVGDLLVGLSTSSKLLVTQAPLDRREPNTQSIPTVGAILREVVDDDAIQYLKKLGVDGEGSVAFDLVLAARVWHIDSPEPVVEHLHAQGLVDALGDGRFVFSPFMMRLGRLLRESGDTTGEAERTLRIAKDTLEGRDPDGETEIEVDVANMWANSGRYNEALAAYHVALERTPPIPDALRAKTLGYIGNAHRNLGRYRAAASAYKEAIGLYERASDHGGLSRELVNLGLMLRDIGDHLEQVRVLERARSLARELGNARELAKATSSVGAAFTLLGRFDDALNAQRDALQLIEQQHAGFIEGYIREDLAFTLTLLEQYDEARLQLDKALKVAEKKGHALLSQSRNLAIAQICLHVGRPAEALEMTSSARAFGSASTLKMRPWAAALHGLALARTGSRDTALTTIREAESAAAELLASNPESYALWYEAAFAVAGRTVLTGSSGSDVIDRYSEAMRRCRSAGVVLSAQRLLTEWKPLDTCSVLDETLRALCVDVALGPHDRDRSWPGPTFAPNG